MQGGGRDREGDQQPDRRTPGWGWGPPRQAPAGGGGARARWGRARPRSGGPSWGGSGEGWAAAVRVGGALAGTPAPCPLCLERRPLGGRARCPLPLAEGSDPPFLPVPRPPPAQLAGRGRLPPRSAQARVPVARECGGGARETEAAAPGPSRARGGAGAVTGARLPHGEAPLRRAEGAAEGPAPGVRGAPQGGRPGAGPRSRQGADGRQL